MATIFYFPDNTHEVIFSSDPTTEFARIIDERLGRDSYEMFMEIVEGHPDEVSNMEQEMRSYEMSLEDDRNVFQDVLAECDYIDWELEQKRVDRKELKKTVDKIRSKIGEVC